MTSPTQYDPNEVLFGSGSPSFKFDAFGDTAQGVITDLKATQQTDFNDGSPKFWQNGDPMLQVVVTLQTMERDPEIEDDDGKRNIYVRGKSMTDAVRDAVKRAGQRKLEVGSLLTVTYTGDGPKERGKNPPKLYEATYLKPGSAPSQPAVQIAQAKPEVDQQALAAFLASQNAAAATPVAAAPEPVPAAQAPVEGTVEPSTDPLAGVDEKTRALVERMLADQAANKG